MGVISVGAGRLSRGLDSLVDGLLSGGVRGGATGVVGKATGHLVLAGGGTTGHGQKLKRIAGGRQREELIDLTSSQFDSSTQGITPKKFEYPEEFVALLQLNL